MVFLILGYGFKNQLLLIFNNLRHKYQPCQQTISYNLGTFDNRFGISREQFLMAVARAEAVWEKPISRELFIYQPNKAELTLNLIYDFRQETTKRLQNLDLNIDSTQSNYSDLKRKYEILKNQYARDKAAFEQEAANFERQKNTYEQEVAFWNKKGGAPKPEFEKLQAQKTELNRQAEILNRHRDDLNELVNNLNAVVSALNKLAQELNLTVERYNTVGAERGEEFEEGLYRQGPEGKFIDIYEYENQDKLIRVLAHEFGHALDLEHLENPQAIMYRLNQASNEKLTEEDILALKQKCEIK